MISGQAVAGAVAAALVLGASPALSLSEEQENVIRHVGDAIAGEHYCPALRVNDDLVTMALTFHGLQPDGVSRLLRRVAESTANFAAHEPDVICATTRMLYGPEGFNVPNLVSDR